MKKEFNKKELEAYILEDSFKRLSKQYILDCIFNEEIQNKWEPQEGDIIVGSTGNIFVISGYHDLAEELGGRLWFFGGFLCSRDGGCVMNSEGCYTMNRDGKWIDLVTREEQQNLYHAGMRDYRFVPYPHEKNRM